MACEGNGAACRQCQLEREMQGIPARFIPETVRTQLSEILDPRRLLPDTDYRFFAARNKLLPGKVDWLDSQKTQFKTSSINMVLDYLIDRDRDAFTVYQVYHTLRQMNSDGQRIIRDGMPEIRRLYRADSRPGQEHSEPLSVNIGAQANLPGPRRADTPPRPVQREPSPPPPYDSAASQQSNHMAGGDVVLPMNNLNAAWSPGNGSDASQGGSPRDGHHLSGKQDQCDTRMKSAVSRQGNVQHCVGSGARQNLSVSGGNPKPSGSNYAHNRPAPCENSFHPSNHPERNGTHDYLQADARQATEVDFYSNGTDDRNTFSATPPSYEQSQQQHSRMWDQQRAYSQPATQMQDLKLPLEGPVVTPESSMGQRMQRTVQPNTSPSSGRYQNREAQSPPVPQLNRPVSFPASQCPSFRTRHDSTRPVSDANFCSHSGTCSCFTGCQRFVPPSVPGSDMSDFSQSFAHWDRGPASQWEMSEAASDVSVGISPLDESQHQTEVKQPMAGKREGTSVQQYHSMPVNSTLPSARCRQGSLPIPTRQNGLSVRFVFVVAADMDETERLEHQVDALCRQLEAQGINYVVVMSTSSWPRVSLPARVMGKLPPLTDDFRSVEVFIKSCYKKASKVLMLISPGYLRYADAYVGGASEVVTHQQKRMRTIQEKLKEEFFARRRSFRIWPVILHEMKANRVHVPSFLSSSGFYWFPQRPGGEDVLEILKDDLKNRSSGMKRSI